MTFKEFYTITKKSKDENFKKIGITISFFLYYDELKTYFEEHYSDYDISIGYNNVGPIYNSNTSFHAYHIYNKKLDKSYFIDTININKLGVDGFTSYIDNLIYNNQ